MLTPPSTLSSARDNNVDSDSHSNNLVNVQLLTSPQDTKLAHLIIGGQFSNRRTSSQWTSLLTIRQGWSAHEQEFVLGLEQPT